MRIVHEIYHDVQFGGSADAYGQKVGEKPAYRGGRADLVIAPSPEDERQRNTLADTDTLYLEGDLDCLRDFFQAGLDFIETLESNLKEKKAWEAESFKECDYCGGFYNPKTIEHGDGYGLTCMADGTAYVGECALFIEEPKQTDSWPSWTKDVKKGNKFTVESPWPEHMLRQLEAIEDAEHLASWRVRIKRPNLPRVTDPDLEIDNKAESADLKDEDIPFK